MLYDWKGKSPIVHPKTYLAPSACILGDVRLEEGASVWFNAVVRGDINSVTIGRYSNVQDLCAVHVNRRTPTVIGDFVTVGHSAVIHGATINDGALIGMGAIVLDGAVVGEESLVGAGALVPAGTVIPPRSLVLGVPGKVVRQLAEKDLSLLRRYTLSYVALWMEPEEMAKAGLEVPEMI